MSDRPRIGIVGATGAVGAELLRLLEERNVPIGDLKLLASARSAGKSLSFRGEAVPVEEVSEQALQQLDLALFSAGSSTSKQFARSAADAGCVVVDNSSAFRMDPETPLVVPEINPGDISRGRGIIANPNCSTILMAVALWPLHRALGLRRVVCSTYQSASGAGAATMAELEQQAREWAEGAWLTQEVTGRQYVFNLFSHDSAIDPETGYNGEETKMIRETRKIFHDDHLPITVTCIRVPVLRAHSETINVTLANPATEERVRRVLSEAPGIRVVDDRDANKHPEPVDASGHDDVLVGRTRQDVSQPTGYGFDIFLSGDQLRKGAALNAIQIAEHLLEAEKATV